MLCGLLKAFISTSFQYKSVKVRHIKYLYFSIVFKFKFKHIFLVSLYFPEYLGKSIEIIDIIGRKNCHCYLPINSRSFMLVCVAGDKWCPKIILILFYTCPHPASTSPPVPPWPMSSIGELRLDVPLTPRPRHRWHDDLLIFIFSDVAPHDVTVTPGGKFVLNSYENIIFVLTHILTYRVWLWQGQ